MKFYLFQRINNFCFGTPIKTMIRLSIALLRSSACRGKNPSTILQKSVRSYGGVLIIWSTLFWFQTSLSGQSLQCPPPANTNLMTPKYNNGSRDASPNEPAIILWNHTSDRGTTPTLDEIATYGEVGTVWGLAFKAQTKKLYAAAFLKRHCDLSPDGLGAIYEIDLSTPTTAGAGTPTLWMNLNSTTHLGGGAVLFPTETAANRGLAAFNAPNRDAWAYTRVGRQGLGDIEITEDGATMYVMDLTNRQVLEINMATKTVVNRYGTNAPANYVNASDRRPFGIKHHNGELYIGMVSSGETANFRGHLRANVLRLTGSTFTSVFEVDSMGIENPSFPGDNGQALSYRGNSNLGPPNNGLGWYHLSNSDMSIGYPTNNAYSYIQNPIPMVSDIEFDNAGNMVIGLMDLAGHMMGAFNYRPFPTTPAEQNALYNIQSHGDVVRAIKSASTWVKEPAIGKYYNDMESVPQFGFQKDVFKGGMLISDCNGTELVVANMQDPFTTNEGGTVWMKTSNGLMETNNTGMSITPGPSGYAISEGSRVRLYISANDMPSTFGKAAGLGDLEMVMDYTASCTSAVTAVAGPCNPTNNQYTVAGQVTLTNPPAVGTVTVQVVGGASQTFTLPQSSPMSYSIAGQSADGSNHAVNVTVSGVSCASTVNYTAPLSCTATCQADSIKICAGQSVELVGLDGLTNYKWYIINAPGDTAQVGTGQTFTTAIPGNYIFKANDNSGCPVALCCPVTVADSSCCVIDNINLVISNCENKGTLSNANDDEYTFTLNPTGNGLGTAYIVSGLPNSPQTGNYGSPTTFGPYLINAGVLTISVVDNVSSTCNKTASVSPPPSCSDCAVAPPLLTVNDNICPNRTGTINLSQGCGVGTFIEYSTNNGLTWSTAKPLYTTTAKTILARCVNSADNNCKSVDASVTTDPKKCPDGGSDCSVIASTTVDPCQDNGTADVATDDYFTIQVNASASNGGSSQRFEVVIGASLPSGVAGNVLNSGGTAYGSPVTVGQNKQFKADGSSSYVLIVRDIDNKSCFQQVNITPVVPCSSLPPKSPCYPVPCVPIGLQKN